MGLGEPENKLKVREKAMEADKRKKVEQQSEDTDREVLGKWNKLHTLSECCWTMVALNMHHGIVITADWGWGE